jgi:heptosyltransferase-2
MCENPRTVLVLRTCGLGDFILSAPAFNALRARYPESRIILLTTQSTNRDVAKKLASYAGGVGKAPWADLLAPGCVNRVIAIPDVRAPLALLGYSRTLRRERIDLVVQMMDVGTPWLARLKKMVLLFALVGPVRQIGFTGPGAMKPRRISKTDPGFGHHVHGPLRFLRELDGPDAYADADVTFGLVPGTQAEAVADGIISGFSGGRPLVAVAPGAAYGHKDWPLASFVELVRALLAEFPQAMFLVCGTKAEIGKGEVLSGLDPQRIRSICGETSIASSAAVFSRCALVVGNDGGAMHLADAVGVRVVSIVPGLEFPDSIEPWNNRHRAVRHPVDCAPCYSFKSCPEGHNRCMVDLPLTPVLQQCRLAIREAIAATAAD